MLKLHLNECLYNSSEYELKLIIRIVAVLAAIMGIIAVITGSRVLLGMFDPGYQYFIELIVYNIIIGAISIVTGVLIWQRKSKVLLLSIIITVLHIIVLLSLITVYNDIIADKSINAMTFRSIIWILFSMIIWKGNSVLKKKN